MSGEQSAGQRRSRRFANQPRIEIINDVEADSRLDPDGEAQANDDEAEFQSDDDANSDNNASTLVTIELDPALVDIFEKSTVHDTKTLVDDTRKYHDQMLKQGQDKKARLFLQTFKHCMTVAVKHLEAPGSLLQDYILQYLESLASDTLRPSAWKNGRATFIKSIYLMALGGLSASLSVVRRFSFQLVNLLYSHKTVIGADNHKKGIAKVESRVFDSDGRVRAMVLQFFAARGPQKRAIEPTLLLLEKDPLPKVRLQAISTAQAILPRNEFINAIADRVRDPSISVREAAYHSLQEIDMATFEESLATESSGERFHHKVNMVLKGVRDKFTAANNAAWQVISTWLREDLNEHGLVNLVAFAEKLKVVATPEDDAYFVKSSLEKENLMSDIYNRAEQLKIDTDMTQFIHPGMSSEAAFLVRSFSFYLEKQGRAKEGLLPSVGDLMAGVQARYERLVSGELESDIAAYVRENYIVGQLLHAMADSIDLGSQADEINELVTTMLHKPMALDRHVSILFLIRRKCTEQTEDYMARNIDLFHEVRASEPDNNHALVILASGIASNVHEITDKLQLDTLIECAEEGCKDEDTEWLMESLRAYSLLCLTSLEGVRQRLQFLVGFYSDLLSDINTAQKEIESKIAAKRDQIEDADEWDKEELEEEIEALELELDGSDSEQVVIQHSILFALTDVMLRFKFQHSESFEILKEGLKMRGTTRVICAHLITQLIFSECINKEDEPDMLERIIALYVANFHNAQVPVTVAGKITIQGIKDSIYFFLTAYCYKEESKAIFAGICIQQCFNNFSEFAREVSTYQESFKSKHSDDAVYKKPDYDIEERLAGYRSMLESWMKLLDKREKQPTVVPSRSFLPVILLDILELLPQLALSIKVETASRKEMKSRSSAAVRVYHKFNGILADIIKQIFKSLNNEEEITGDLAASLIRRSEQALEKKYLNKSQSAVIHKLLDKLRAGAGEANMTQLSDDEVEAARGPLSPELASPTSSPPGSPTGSPTLAEDVNPPAPQFTPILQLDDEDDEEIDEQHKRARESASPPPTPRRSKRRNR